jgi:RNA polymerase-binding protein DksA
MLAKTKNYRPSDKEPFMNERQREYFRAKLLAWREDILKEAKETLLHLQEENQNHPDLADRASSETDRAIELRARDRQRKLIAKIARPHRRRHLRLLRGDRRADLTSSSGSPPDRNIVGGGAGTA